MALASEETLKDVLTKVTTPPIPTGAATEATLAALSAKLPAALGPTTPANSVSVAVAESSILCTWQVSLVASTPKLLVPAWASGTAYKVGEVVTNDSGKMYRCITAGTSAGSGGPTGTASDITDNSAHWAYVASFGGGIVIGNPDTTLAIPIYWGTDSGLTTSKASAAIMPLSSQPLSSQPTGIYLVAGSNATATVAAAV